MRPGLRPRSRLAGCEVLGDLRVRQAREFGDRQVAQEFPAHRHALFERAGGGLADQRALETRAEGEVAPIGIGQAVFADDACQQPGLRRARIGRVQLAGQCRMVGVRVALAGAVLHQPREARQHVDGRVDTGAIEFTRQHDLAFGDVAGQIRDRVADVVRRHRQDRQLRQRSLDAVQAPRPFVERREVRVHVAGIALAAGNFALGPGHFAQRLAVIGEIGDDDQHVLALLEREVLGGGQREARRQQALCRRVAGEIEEQRRALQRAGLFERAAEVFGGRVGHADAGEHDGEVRRLGSAQARVGGDLDRNAVVRQAAAREDRQLLAPHQRVHQVHRRHAGFDEGARCRPRDGVQRHAVDAQPLLHGERRAAVDDDADAIEYPAEDPGTDAEIDRFAEKANDGVRQRESGRGLEHLDGDQILVDGGNAAKARRAVAPGDDDGLVQSHVERAPHEEQRAVEPHRGVMHGDPRLHACLPSGLLACWRRPASKTRVRRGAPVRRAARVDPRRCPRPFA